MRQFADMRIRWASVLLLTACVADIPETEGSDESAIVGGANAAAGKWPDVTAVLWDGQQTCTGTLIAPNVVLTAGHCNDPSLDKVLIGTTSLARPTEGQTIAVIKRAEYPASQTSEDLTVLVLESASRFTPRAIATGWARAEIKNGAHVEIAGFGAVDKNAMQFKNDLQEAETSITDFDCSTPMKGCNLDARPAGELGAGGDMGIDTCNGDSGGPLYVLTSYGSFLAGVTSRSYDGAGTPCGEGGIYARPDKVISWIEEQAGKRVTHGPEPTVEPLVAVRGNGGETRIEHHDPKTDQHTFTVKQQPAHGQMAAHDDGRVRMCADGSSATTDQAIVTVTDTQDPSRSVDVTVPIMIEDGTPGSCDLEAFTDSSGGGCCDSGRSARGSLPLAVGVLLALRRRRRR